MKSEIRKKALEKRDLLAGIEKSGMIAKRLLTSPEYRQAKTIGLYYSIHSEVRTHQLIQEVMKEKTLVLPVTDKHEKRLHMSILTSFDDLEKGTFGVMEPANRILIDPEEMDMLVIPGVAFDEYGNRIGYGKGYYDILLRGIDRKEVLVCALAYECQIISKVPHDENDQPVDMIITEDRIIRCKG